MHLCTWPQPLFMSASQSGHGLGGSSAITFYLSSLSPLAALTMQPLAALTTLPQAVEITPRWEFRRRRPARRSTRLEAGIPGTASFLRKVCGRRLADLP